MAHFARVVDGIVVDVIVCDEEHILNGYAGNPSEWIQTSYNTNGGVHYLPDSNIPSTDQSKALRKNFAGVGYKYDAERDAFIPPKVFESWVFNEETCHWEPPVPMPDRIKSWAWDESIVNWIDLGTVENSNNTIGVSE